MISARSMLAVYGLQCQVGGKVLLDEISFELEEGRLIGLMGPNGSGKTTLLKTIAGILNLPFLGQLYSNGQDLKRLPASNRVRKLVYVPPDLRVEFPMSAYEFVALGRLYRGKGTFGFLKRSDEDRILWAMEKMLCWDLRERQIQTLSGGERQRVLLAQALAQEAKILLLDEALSKMDLHHQAEMGMRFQKLASEGYLIVWVAHDLNLLSEWADEGLFLQKGRLILQGSVPTLFEKENLLRLYPGARIEVGKNPKTGKPKIFFI